MTVLENLLVAQHNKLMLASGYSVFGLLGLRRFRDAEAAAIALARGWLERIGLVADAEWTLSASDLFCTMKRSRKILNLPAKANSKLTKPPSNTELYRHLYKRRPGDAVGPLHDAINDCKLTALCFAAAQKRGWW